MLVVDVLDKIFAVNAVHGSVRQRDSSAEVVADTPTDAVANLVNNRELCQLRDTPLSYSILSEYYIYTYHWRMWRYVEIHTIGMSVWSATHRRIGAA